MSVPHDALEVVAFWKAAGFPKWFGKNEAFDAELRTRFSALHDDAAAEKLANWSDTPEGALALMILLDQFPRNAFRGTARMFATDELARRYANAALEAGHDERVEKDLRMFFYLPFEHSERVEDQNRSVALHEKIGMTKWAIEHRDIIVRFGRFPHRNPVLGRESTEEEKKFLAEGGFSG